MFSSTCLLTKVRQTSQDFFSMLRHEESSKILIIIWQPSILDKVSTLFYISPPPPTLSSKNFQTPPFSSILDSKIRLPPFVKEGTGVELWDGFTPYMVPIGTIYPLFFYIPYNRVPYFESKYHPTP